MKMSFQLSLIRHGHSGQGIAVLGPLELQSLPLKLEDVDICTGLVWLLHEPERGLRRADIQKWNHVTVASQPPVPTNSRSG